MRLVHTGSPVGLPTREAHAIQVTRMCEAFADLGLETCLLTTVPAEAEQPMPVEQIPGHYDVRPVFRIRRLRGLDLPLPPAAKRLFRHVSYALRAWIFILRHYNDEESIIYSRERFTSYLLCLSARWLKARHIFESHNYLGEKRPKTIAALFSKLDRLVTLTPFIGQKYVEAGVPGERVLSAANGVDPGRFYIAESRRQCRARLGLEADRPFVGYVGNFRNTMGMEKGISELIHAQATLLERMANPPLLVCVGGPAECIPSYQRLAGRLGIGPEHILFPGYADRGDVPCWLRACDVLTIPWPPNNWAAEQTSPIKLFEYMASGTPIVASDLPSIREILADGRNALLTAPGKPGALASAIAELLDNPDRGERFAAAARDDVAGYTWARRAARVLDGLIPSRISRSAE